MLHQIYATTWIARVFHHLRRKLVWSTGSAGGNSAESRSHQRHLEGSLEIAAESCQVIQLSHENWCWNVERAGSFHYYDYNEQLQWPSTMQGTEHFNIFYTSRCEESHNTKRAESINFAFTKARLGPCSNYFNLCKIPPHSFDETISISAIHLTKSCLYCTLLWSLNKRYYVL